MCPWCGAVTRSARTCRILVRASRKTSATRTHHIVKEAYLLHSGPEHDRPCWDESSVLYAVFPDRDFFGLSSAGRVTVADDGFHALHTAEQAKQRSST